jgi:opacity protein-like surface antigen
MKKLSILLALLSFVILFQPKTSHAQLNISLGPSIGLTTPVSDFGGNPSDYYLGNKYGLKSSINFGAMGKLGLGPINFNLSILYSPMSNSGVADPSKPNSNADISMHLLTIGIGSDFGFGVPLAPIRPYIGFDLLFSSLGGSVTFTGVSNVTSNTIDMSSASRTGLGFAGGVQINLMSIKLDASLRYNLINLFSNSYDGSATGDRIEAYKFLNDAKDPNYSTASNDKHPIGGNRTIATFQIQLGIMFGL